MKLNISSSNFLYLGLILLGSSGFFFTMFVEHPRGFYAFIVIAALAGFCVALNVWYTKKNNLQLVCPTGSDCNSVINSKFSKFFGIRLEILGMIYFAVIILGYLGLIFFPEFFVGNRLVALAMLTIGAALFSSYLLFVQDFILEQWCIWCILTAFMSLTIFLFSLISLPMATGFLSGIAGFISMLKFLGFILGLGSTIAAIVLFLGKFLKDDKIDEKECDILGSLSELIWLGLGLTLMSEFIFYVVNPSLIQDETFVARIIALMISAFTGAVFMIIFAPFLTYIPFGNTEEIASPLKNLRKPIFALGALSVSSWFFAFATNFITNGNLLVLIISYTVFSIAVIMTSLLWEKSLNKSQIPTGLQDEKIS